MRKSAGLVSASALWAAGIGVSPWLPEILGIFDPTAISLILSMIFCGFAPSLLLGAFLGRARACRLLATCGTGGPGLWMIDLWIMRDPDVHASDSPYAAFIGVSILILIIAPLVGGAVGGRTCSRSAAAHSPDHISGR
jgi:hypothetical protein